MLAAAIAAVTTITISAQTGPPAQAAAQTPAAKFVASAALEPLLPAPPGWTRTRTRGSEVVVSDSCAYSFADATYTNGEMKVQVTLADTAQNEESLGLLATLVVSFPADYTGVVPPATSIARLTLNGAPAGSRWDAEVRDGEFVALVGHRFVAKVEGTKLDDIATLRGIIELIDLKKLGQLK
jgi:hypothetical protein